MNRLDKASYRRLVRAARLNHEAKTLPPVAGSVRDIRVCHLPYQPGPFVVGMIDNAESPTGESNVWLRSDGAWTTIDGDPLCTLQIGSWNPPNDQLSDRHE